MWLPCCKWDGYCNFSSSTQFLERITITIDGTGREKFIACLIFFVDEVLETQKLKEELHSIVLVCTAVLKKGRYGKIHVHMENMSWNSCFNGSCYKRSQENSYKTWPSIVWRHWSKTSSILAGEMWTCLLALLVNEGSKCHWAVLLWWSSSKAGDEAVVLMLGCARVILCWWPHLSSGQDIQRDSKSVAYEPLQGLASYFASSSILGKKRDLGRLCPAFLLPCWNKLGIVPRSRCVFHILQYICLWALALIWMASIF